MLPVSDPTLVLGFDSSTEWLSVALSLDDTRTLQRTEPGGARASMRLLPLVTELLAEAGVGLRDVGLIGFGAGPGAFTGLRAACAAAQGLGRGLGCPVVPVPTLLAVAASLEPCAPRARALVANDARMGEMYWALAGAPGAPADWRLEDPARVQSPAAAAGAWRDAFGAEAPSDLLLCGNAWTAHGAALREALGAGWDAALRAARVVAPGAAAVARLARCAQRRGEAVPAAQARPLYVRDKVALTSAERALAAAQGGGA